MDDHEKFRARNEELIEQCAADEEVQSLTRRWMDAVNPYEYSYHFEWLSRPIIQYPQDILAFQELVWRVQPDLIVETGIARGGSLILSASLLAMIDYCEAVQAGEALDPRATKRRVVGVDIDIRAHNRAAIEAHPLAHRIDMIEGSSVDDATVARVADIAASHDTVLVSLDSNHTHEHVLAELEAYAPLVSPGSYCLVFDTLIENLPAGSFPDRPWDRGDNPKTAVREFLRRLREDGRTAGDGQRLAFETDVSVQHKLLITVAPDGYLRRVP